ncbi:protein YicS [Escherichia coli]|uniref:protein YicS n=7 Tax=Pseudomonadota TaxID=1224 RepID=UPI00227EA713|nr:protein YicS [Escherichia coli]
MKPTTLLLIFTFFAMPGIVYAESPFSSLQSAKEKTTVLQDLRKICTPQASLSDEAWEKLMLSDEAWEKLMLSDENNKQHIREAIVAMERNNQSNYWEALGKVECPDM